MPTQEEMDNYESEPAEVPDALKRKFAQAEEALKEAQQIGNELPAVLETACLNPYKGLQVLIRTYSAGVHFGTMGEKEGQSIILHDSRRLWQWKGAFTLSAVAQDGVAKEGCKISRCIPKIQLEQVIEIIPMSELAGKQLMNYPDHE